LHRRDGSQAPKSANRHLEDLHEVISPNRARIALCALAGTVAAQSYPSTTTPMKDQAPRHPALDQCSRDAGWPADVAGDSRAIPHGLGRHAYKSLDASNRGYLSKSDVQGIAG
jgi:hypothetical protein